MNSFSKGLSFHLIVRIQVDVGWKLAYYSINSISFEFVIIMKRSTSLTLALFCFIGMASHGLVWKKYQAMAKIDFYLRQQSFTKSSESGCSFLLLICFSVSRLCVPEHHAEKIQTRQIKQKSW